MKLQDFNKNHFLNYFYLDVLSCENYFELCPDTLKIFYQLFLLFSNPKTIDYNIFFNELKAHFLTFKP